MKKVLFIDRDGTLIVEPTDNYQIDSYEKLQFLPEVLYWLSKIVRETDFELVMVTNQDGLGTASFPETDFWPAHQKMMDILTREGIVFKDVFIDTSFEHENKATRKPGTGLLNAYLYGPYDLAQSWVIGDRASDVQLAKNLGSKSFFIGNTSLPEATKTVHHWQQIYETLVLQPRISDVRRTTKETDIRVTLNLDGQGKSTIQTGIGFFDHMLEQVARHGMMDLDVQVQGDLHIDEHHTVEDTALALGQAFKTALGSKKGIERYAFVLPMDDCLAQVALDFGGRPWLVWEADFQRPMIGQMATELFFHFFKSFSDAAACNLNIQVQGDNEHHKIESIFKAFAKCIRQAVATNDHFQIPSTKGTLS